MRCKREREGWNCLTQEGRDEARRLFFGTALTPWQWRRQRSFKTTRGIYAREPFATGRNWLDVTKILMSTAGSTEVELVVTAVNNLEPLMRRVEELESALFDRGSSHLLMPPREDSL